MSAGVSAHIAQSMYSTTAAAAEATPPSDWSIHITAGNLPTKLKTIEGQANVTIFEEEKKLLSLFLRSVY